MFDTVEELLEQIALGEDSILECKSVQLRGTRVVGPDARKLADEVAAMANAKGGVIVLGVEDATHAVVGIARVHLDAVETWARSFLFDCIQPPVAASIRRLWLPDAKGRKCACLRLDVPEGQTVHRSPGGYFQRIGSSKREFAPDELARKFQERTQASYIPFDEQFKPDTTPDLLDAKLCRRFRVRLVDNEDAVAFRRKMKLTTLDPQGVERLTTAGVLMATEEPESIFPSAYIQAVAYRGTVRDAADQLDQLDIGGPLDEQIATACKFVRRNMRVYGVKEMGRIDIPQYSMTAVFEAVANAVAHRDYAVQGSKIRLHMFADRLELFSPGGLPDRLTVEDLPYRQAARNQLLCSLLARCPMPLELPDCSRAYVMDRRGEGVPVIYERTRGLTGQAPEYRLLGESELMLTIRAFPELSAEDLKAHVLSGRQKGGEVEQKPVGEQSDSTRNRTISVQKHPYNGDVQPENGSGSTRNGKIQPENDDVSTRNRGTVVETILAQIRENPSITQRAMADRLAMNRNTLAYWFEKLKHEGVLRHEGSAKGGWWEILPTMDGNLTDEGTKAE